MDSCLTYNLIGIASAPDNCQGLCYTGFMRIPVKMQQGAGYCTPQGIQFTAEHPFQLVDESDVGSLLLLGEKFRVATADEIREYYGVNQED